MYWCPGNSTPVSSILELSCRMFWSDIEIALLQCAKSPLCPFWPYSRPGACRTVPAVPDLLVLLYSSDQKVISWVFNPNPHWALRFHVVSVRIGRPSPLTYPYLNQLPAPLHRGNEWLCMLLHLLQLTSKEEVGVTVDGKELRQIYSLCQALRLQPTPGLSSLPCTMQYLDSSHFLSRRLGMW